MFDREEQCRKGAIRVADDMNCAKMQPLDQCSEVLCINDGRVTWPGLILIRGIVPPAVGYCAIASFGELGKFMDFRIRVIVASQCLTGCG